MISVRVVLWRLFVIGCFQVILLPALAQICGREADGAICQYSYDCCSQHGWCGTGDECEFLQVYHAVVIPAFTLRCVFIFSQYLHSFILIPLSVCGRGCQSGACYPTPAPTVSPHPTSSQIPSYPLRTGAPFSENDCLELKNTINFGYYASWASSRWCDPVAPDEIDVQKFGYTHLAYSFAGISTDGKLEPYYGNTAEYSSYELFNSLKYSNPNLKTLIAVGGWTFDQSRFSYVSMDSGRRRNFAKSVVAFLETHGFDGIDLGE